MKKLLLLTLVVFPAACGGGSGGGTIALSDLGPRVMTALCTFEVRCGLFPDQATCVAASPSNLGQLMADVQSGKTLYDGTAASDCLDYLAGLSCAVSSTSDLSSKRCDDAFKGTAAAGASCFTAEECASASCDIVQCTTGLACCAGTCGAVVAAIPKGGACDLVVGGTSCVDGSSCQSDATGANTTCQPLLAAGAPCVNFGDCVAGTECQQDGLGGGSCARFPATGEPCDPNGLPCSNVTDACDATTGTCVRRAAVGAACQSEDACVLYAACDPTALTCVARKGIGGACAVESDCLNGLACANGACAVQAAAAVCP
jgi:hypothetical protein